MTKVDVIIGEENIVENNTNKRKRIISSIKRPLDIMLKLEANSASCTVLYEPKKPEGLSKFKRKN